MSKVEMKRCSTCKEEYPATTEYFYKDGKGLQSRCKKCDKEVRKKNLKKERQTLSKSRIVLTEKEEKSFTKKAEEFGMSKSDFLKLLIIKGEAEPLVKINPECFDNFNYQIMGIARNINQIAHVCNMTGNIHITDIENIRNDLIKIREWQSKLENEFKMIDSSIKYAHEVITFDDI